MIEIKITGDNPLESLASVTAYGILCMENREVFDAANVVLDHARSKQTPVAPAATPVPPTTPPAPPSTAAAAPTGQTPAGSAGAASPNSTVPSDPVPAPVTGVPVAPAPTYTLEQISKAGAELISRDPSLRDTLMRLLRDQGVEAVTQLDPAQYGAYATALRGLGAKI